jgi:hypothetical protein
MLKLRQWGKAIVLPHHLPCLHDCLCRNTKISTKACIFRGAQKQCAKCVVSPSHHPLPLMIVALCRNLSYHGKIKKDVKNKAMGERNDALNWLTIFVVYPRNLVGWGMAMSKSPLFSYSCCCASSLLMLMSGVTGSAVSGVAVKNGQRQCEHQPSPLTILVGGGDSVSSCHASPPPDVGNIRSRTQNVIYGAWNVVLSCLSS